MNALAVQMQTQHQAQASDQPRTANAETTRLEAHVVNNEDTNPNSDNIIVDIDDIDDIEPYLPVRIVTTDDVMPAVCSTMTRRQFS